MMILQTSASSRHHHLYLSFHSDSPSGLFNSRRRPLKLSFQNLNLPHFAASPDAKLSIAGPPKLQVYCSKTSLLQRQQTCQGELSVERSPKPATLKITENIKSKKPPLWISALSFGSSTWLIHTQVADATQLVKLNPIYETGELFELGIQLSYLLLLLALLGVGSFYVIRQVLVRRELDLSAKELQEQVRSGDANSTELFELGAVMLRRKFYPAAVKYLQQAIDNWDGDNQDLAQVYNALGVSYVRDEKIDKGIAQFESAVKIQPGYVTAWNNLGDALEKKEDITAALKAFEEVLLFDSNNKIARPRRDALKDKVAMYRGVPVKTKKKSTMPR